MRWVVVNRDKDENKDGEQSVLIICVQTVACAAEEIGLCTHREWSSLKTGRCSVLAEVALLIAMVYLS